jgi:hypothetical protein
MIQVTLGALVNAEEPLARLGAEKLPFQIAYHIATLRRLVAIETKHFHEQRNAFVMELGAKRAVTKAEQKMGHTEIIEVTPANRGEFKSRVDKLSAVEVELAAKPLNMADLVDAAISSNDVQALEPLLAGAAPVTD